MTRLFLSSRGRLKRKDPKREAMHAQLTAETYKPRRQTEQTMQIALIRDLRAVLAPSVFLTHIPSGFIAGRGGPLRGAFLKAMGLVPGLPDLMLLHEGVVYFLEVKAPKGKLSPAQAECHIGLRRAGCHVEVVKSLDEALNCLTIWNLPTRLAKAAA